MPTLATYAAIAVNGPRLGWSPAMLEKTEKVKDQGLEAIRIARAAGVKIGFGSDLLGDMHASQSNEFTLRLEAMPAVEILMSATSVNAELMGQSGRLGTIAEGAIADLLVIDGNPLENIALLQSESSMPVIMQGGRFHRRAL